MSIGKSKNNLGKNDSHQIELRKAILKEMTRKSLNKLAVDAGISNGTADDWTDKQIEKPTRTVSDFLSFYNISPEWWRTGKGNVFEEKPTSVQETTDNKEMDNTAEREELYRKLVEGNSDYLIIPKSVLKDNYRIVSLEQFEKDKKQIEKEREQIAKDREELQSKNKQINDLYEIIKQMAGALAPIQPAKPLKVKEG